MVSWVGNGDMEEEKEVSFTDFFLMFLRKKELKVYVKRFVNRFFEIIFG